MLGSRDCSGSVRGGSSGSSRDVIHTASRAVTPEPGCHMVVHHGDYLISWQSKFVVESETRQSNGLDFEPSAFRRVPCITQVFQHTGPASTHNYTGAAALLSASEEVQRRSLPTK
jgi:hypothetical protein